MISNLSLEASPASFFSDLMTRIAKNEPIAAFDYNGNYSIDS